MKLLQCLKDLQSSLSSDGVSAIWAEYKSEVKEKLQECIDSWDADDDNYPSSLSESVTLPVGNPITIINVCGEIVKAGGLNEDICDELGICDIDNVRLQLEAAAQDNDPLFIVMNFDTPGGTATGVKELAELISTIAKDKMVIGFSSGLCCSAGYWLFSQCSMCFCSDSSKMGNVGVLTERVDLTKQLDMSGVKVSVLKDGAYKDFGHPATKMGATEEAMINERLATIGKWFRDAIQAKRQVSTDNLQGQIFLGEDAADPAVNLADGNFDSIEELLSVFYLLTYV